MHNFPVWVAVLPALLIAAEAASPLFAQNIFGTILGTVRDPQGGPIAGAKVSATDTATGQTANVYADNSGNYQFVYLKPGPYTVTVTAPGFQSSQRQGVNLRVEDRIRLDFALAVGAVSTTVTVRSTTPPVDSASASLGHVVSSQTTQALPLQGRNIFDLVGLSPEVSVNPQSTGEEVLTGGFEIADISVAGGRFRTNEYLLDGVSIMMPDENEYAISPTPEGTQEFKVMTTDYSPQFGRTGGGVINVITRGGTNDFHGSGTYFFRNDLMRANNYFANANGQPRGIYQSQQFSATAGGHIIRNRTFFFLEYQGYRENDQLGGQLLTLPTAAEHAGDFTGVTSSNGHPVTIYNPFTTQPAGNAFVRTPFPGNQIPASLINPTSARLMSFIPLPNRPGAIDNWAYSPANLVGSDQGSIRIDHKFSDRHSIFVRFTHAEGGSTTGQAFQTIADPNGDNVDIRTTNAVVNGTYDISPTFLVNYRAGFTRRYQDRVPDYFGKISLADLGFPQNVASAAEQQLFPGLAFTGYSSVGTAPGLTRADDLTSWVAEATKIHGAHTFTFGADIRVYDQAPFRATAASGNYSFSPGFTQGPNPLVASLGAGDGFASFLTGYGAGSIEYSPAFDMRNSYFGLYANDDIRLGRLTLNLGLRWDYEQPRLERYNRFASFNFTAPLAGPAGFPQVDGTLIHPGTDGYARGQFNPDYNDFGPRIGAAYRLTNTTALRAGYGIFYLPRVGYVNSDQYGASGADQTTQWVSSVDGVTPLNPISNPYPQGIFPPLTGPVQSLLVGQNLNITPLDAYNNSYVQQYNFSIQQALPDNWMLEAAYVGSTGVDLPIAYQFNQVNPIYQSLGSGLNKKVANPFYGYVAEGVLAQPTVTQAQLLRPFPQYLNIATAEENVAFSQYNSLELMAEKRFSHGYNLMVAYTASKIMDNSDGRVIGITAFQPPIQNAYDLAAERSIGEQDVSQRLVISHSWDVPIGKGHKLLGDLPGPVNALISGWTLSGQATFMTGFPLALTSIGNSGVFSAELRPNSTGQSAVLSGTPETRLNHYFNTADFTVPDPYTFGNVARTLPNVRGPGERVYNLSLSKIVHVNDRVSMEFRGEAYNLTNTPYFGMPGMTLGSKNFGVISSATGDRQIQLALKLLW